VIEQYTIATTPKYNFPQTLPLTDIPKRFIELSLNSLRQVRKANQPDPLMQSDMEKTQAQFKLKVQPVILTPRYQHTTVSAVDTSVIKIGETQTGIVIAVRGATVRRLNRNYSYTRLGPFIFHLTEENKNIIYDNLEKAYFAAKISYRQCAPTLMQMPMRLANLLERWLQSNLAHDVSNAIMLLDGSLTSGTPETPAQRLREILSTARENGNVVLGFSKATSLRSNGYLITDRLPDKDPPYLLETSGLRPKMPMVLLGDVYVARLNKAKIAFRLDIDHEVPFENRLEAVEKLMGNDAIQQSYPETLRLAHILCTFTANEILAMQHFTTRRHGIQFINRPDMHRLLFGPFGRECFA
jgi:hypothetical protein